MIREETSGIRRNPDLSHRKLKNGRNGINVYTAEGYIYPLANEFRCMTLLRSGQVPEQESLETLYVDDIKYKKFL